MTQSDRHDALTWDRFVRAHPRAHFLQLDAWGRLKSRFGWTSQRVVQQDGSGRLRAGAQILFRRMAGVTLAYIPKGPLVDWRDRESTAALLAEVERAARTQGAALLKVEPDLPDTPENRARLRELGFRSSPHTIQPRSTILVDLAPPEDVILARMKSKWRYNVRLAARRGVTVRAATAPDLSQFQALMEATAARDGFAVHSGAYYRAAHELFTPGQGVFLLAEAEGELLAGIVVLLAGRSAWYVWGASSDRRRNLMPNHALQWAAMQWAKARGATRYDLWGVPDEIGQIALGMSRDGQEPVPAQIIPVDVGAFPQGDLWGVFRFKQGFGGVVERSVGAWDLAYSPRVYPLYRAGVALHKRGATPERLPGLLREVARDALDAARRRASMPSPPPIPVQRPQDWRAGLAQLPAPHVLQSWEWGEVKAQTGWRARRYVLEGPAGLAAAFQLLVRPLVPGLPLALGYVPKGPVVDWSDEIAVAQALAAIEYTALANGCLLMKIDPDAPEEGQVGRRLQALLRARGWRPSPEQIQFKNTAFTDLTQSEEALLAGMKSKWRYNIRLAQRRGVQVRVGGLEDLESFYRLYRETSQRDGFLIRPASYYTAVWRAFLAAQASPATPAGGALLLAEHPEEEEPVAGLFLLRYGTRAWYFYGASSQRRRRDMPNYLLQWEALGWARAQGCIVYDWWGAPNRLDDPDDVLQGVWRFKQGFGARFQAHVGAWDWSPHPLLWQGYHRGAPLLRAWLGRG